MWRETETGKIVREGSSWTDTNGIVLLETGTSGQRMKKRLLA